MSFSMLIAVVSWCTSCGRGKCRKACLVYSEETQKIQSARGYQKSSGAPKVLFFVLPPPRPRLLPLPPLARVLPLPRLEPLEFADDERESGAPPGLGQAVLCVHDEFGNGDPVMIDLPLLQCPDWPHLKHASPEAALVLFGLSPKLFVLFDCPAPSFGHSL